MVLSSLLAPPLLLDVLLELLLELLLALKLLLKVLLPVLPAARTEASGRWKPASCTSGSALSHTWCKGDA